MSLACSLLLATCFKHAISKLINLRHKIHPWGVQYIAVLKSNASLFPQYKQILQCKKTTLSSNLMPLLYIIPSQCPPLQTTYFCQCLDSSMPCQDRILRLLTEPHLYRCHDFIWRKMMPSQVFHPFQEETKVTCGQVWAGDEWPRPMRAHASSLPFHKHDFTEPH